MWNTWRVAPLASAIRCHDKAGHRMPDSLDHSDNSGIKVGMKIHSHFHHANAFSRSKPVLLVSILKPGVHLLNTALLNFNRISRLHFSKLHSSWRLLILQLLSRSNVGQSRSATDREGRGAW